MGKLARPIRPVVTEVETDLKRRITQTLRTMGFKVYVTSERRKGYSKMPVGLPDLFARHAGKRFCVWIEVKQPGEKLTEEQEEFRLDTLTAGENHWTLRVMTDLYRELCRSGFVTRS